MLFDLFIGGLEMLADTIEYGPAKAFEINTSVCPQAERDSTRIIRELHKIKPEIVERDDADESVMDKEEEAIIDQAVEEKGRW